MALSTISTATTSISALSNVILAVPQLVGLFAKGPQNVVGYQPQNPQSNTGQIDSSQKALMFHYEGEQSVALTSDITDHFIEDNTAIQDQISLKPEIISTHGFIGELNDVPPTLLAPLQAVANRLLTISAYTPSVSISALIAYNSAFQAYQTANTLASSLVSAVSSLTGSGGESVINGTTLMPAKAQNLQQQMFQQFYGYWSNRILFTVQTPWAVFQNCAIQSLRAVQDADSQVITDFEVTFKVIRMANTITNAPIKNGRLTSQSALSTFLGTITPAGVPGIPGI